MHTIEKTHPDLAEAVIRKTLPSGLKCYIIPKDGVRAYALTAVDFGAADLSYRDGDRQVCLPPGTAHFLEHKLYEKEWGDAFAAFAAGGAAANAFTDADRTAYYFSAATDFEKHFRLLLRLMEPPRFEEGSVAREREIIGQEIDLYADKADWSAYFRMLSCLFPRHPVRNQVAGSRESIEEIDEKILYDCYERFYQPANMILVCAGPVNASRILTLAEEAFSAPTQAPLPRLIPPEPDRTRSLRTRVQGDAAVPVFTLGIRVDAAQTQGLRAAYGFRLLLDTLFGEGSDFYAGLYRRGALDEPVGLSFQHGRGYAFAALSGVSPRPRAVWDAVWETVDRCRAEGLSNRDIERVRQKQMGRFQRGLGDTEAALMSQATLGLRGEDIVDAYAALEALGPDDAAVLLGFLNADDAVMAVAGGKG